MAEARDKALDKDKDKDKVEEIEKNQPPAV